MNNKIKTMTPHAFIQSLNSFQAGDTGFCAIATITTKNNCIKGNIGFWFEVIENDAQPVLSVQMDSFTIDRPIKGIIITGTEQLHTYIKSMRQWMEEELTSFFSFPFKPHKNIQLERHD